MTSHKLVFPFFLKFALVVLLISPSHASSDDGTDSEMVLSTNSQFDDQVSLSLFYEALCPYCANFIVNQLVKIFQTDLISIVNLRLVPWGNTQSTAKHSWLCQHGPDECLLDTVEACAINVWRNLEVHFQFIECIERLHLENRHTQWQSCFGELNLNPNLIGNCFRSGYGAQLELNYANETDRLNPPHTFVPWVLVNNQPLKEDYQNFVAYVCRAYRGQNKPKACESQRVQINTSNMVYSSHQVCYAREAENLTSSAKKIPGSAKASSTKRKKETPR